MEVIESALSLGIKVLHVPRVALGSLYELTDESWSKDELFSRAIRHNRYSAFVRAFPDVGPNSLRRLGAELVHTHSLGTRHLEHLEGLPHWPTAAEMMWMQGLLAEFDGHRKFKSQKQFIQHVRSLIAEWTDLDILASHYSYGNDIFCSIRFGKRFGHPWHITPRQPPRLDREVWDMHP